jgi:eukaryotic-like serine/threonine-protein kinase
MQIEVLGERYQLQDPIGRGGMATIYRGRDIRMDRFVAIKVLREVYSTDPKFVTRFQREAKAASALQHPNIVQVYDYGQSDGNYFIVMELIDGTDLRRYMRSRGILATERAIIIAHDIALGLGAAHRRGIVHRDVKPQNVLVGRDGSIKLTDFGIASVYKDINDERLTTTGMTLGTVQYYAPEQAQGEIVSPAADVYALGIVIYEMMTGRTPFDGDTPVAVAMAHIQDPPTPPSHLNPNIPPALEEIILRCLEKVPEMRYRDGNVLARALESLGDGSLATGTAPTLPSNSTVISPSTSGTQHQIPPRPNAMPNGAYAPSNSSPNNQMEAQQHAQGYPVGDDAPTYRVDQNYSPMAAAQADYDPNAAPYGMPPLATGTGATHPFSGAIDRPDSPRDTRFASVVTILILCAALLFLGLAVFLASDLGYLNFGNSSQVQVTPTTTPAQIAVPDLIGKTYSDADAMATQDNFHLVLGKGSSQDGVVSTQDPQPPAKAAPGSTITVTMKPAPVKIPEVKGETLTQAQQSLTQAGLKNIKIVSDPNDPNDPTLQVNTITRTDPAGNTTVPDPSTPVTVYVTNYGTAPVQPTQAPQAIPTPVPTTAPTPVPTTAPTAISTPKPKHTPTPVVPTSTSVPIVTPTPTGGTGQTGATPTVTGQ